MILRVKYLKKKIIVSFSHAHSCMCTRYHYYHVLVNLLLVIIAIKATNSWWWSHFGIEIHYWSASRMILSLKLVFHLLRHLISLQSSIRVYSIPNSSRSNACMASFAAAEWKHLEFSHKRSSRISGLICYGMVWRWIAQERWIATIRSFVHSLGMWNMFSVKE